MTGNDVPERDRARGEGFYRVNSFYMRSRAERFYHCYFLIFLPTAVYTRRTLDLPIVPFLTKRRFYYLRYYKKICFYAILLLREREIESEIDQLKTKKIR